VLIDQNRAKRMVAVGHRATGDVERASQESFVAL